MSSTLITILVILAVLIVAAAVAAFVIRTNRRRGLQERFGPEYERAVAEHDSRADAERDLHERERRHADLELHELPEESRQRYATAWESVQAQFVDDPNGAVDQGDQLFTELLTERGYRTDDHDEQVALLSVEHAATLGHYRDAHDIHLRNQRQEATTEQLRQALVHYRAIFADILGTDPIAHAANGHHDTHHDAADTHHDAGDPHHDPSTDPAAEVPAQPGTDRDTPHPTAR